MSPQERGKIIQQEWNNQQNKDFAVKVSPTPVKKNEQIQKEKDLPMSKEMFQKITLRAQDLPLSEILKPLADTVSCHLILAQGVENKKVSVDLIDVPVEKVLNTLLFPLGYGFKVKDGDLIILASETKIFRLILPPITGGFNDMTSNESTVQTQGSSNNNNSTTNTNNNSQQVKLGTKIQVSNSSEGISFWSDVVENLKGLISSQGKYSINKPAGIVIVTDTPISLERIGQYFEDLNNRASEQIEVDVKVVEVTLNNENHFGVDWNTIVKNLKVLNSLSVSTNFASENFTNGAYLTFSGDASKPGAGDTKGGIQFVIDALAKQGKVDVVSQPKLRILNNQVAIIQVGSAQSYIDNSTIQVTQTGTITSVSTSQVQEGVTMRLLGNIVADQIYLSVTPVVTTIDSIRTITVANTKIEAPQTTSKSIDTLVKVKEGQTVAIGGLITSNHKINKQSVPILSSIPLLGKLFEYSENINNKTELIVFITPKRG